jgi:hypothetical protein
MKKIVLEYDTKFTPLSHDIITSLAIIRAYGLAHSWSTSIDVLVKVSNGRNVGVEAHYDASYRKKKTVDVLVAVLANCRWVESFALIDENSDLQVSTSCTVIPSAQDKAKRDPRVPEWAITPYAQNQLENLTAGRNFFLQDGFVASEAALNYAKDLLPADSVVIHPRSSKISPERNTPIPLFDELVRRLGRSRVFMIPDAEGLSSLRPWHEAGVTPIPEAASSLDLRVALATACRWNVLWGAGNSYPLHFSAAKFVLIGALNSSSPMTNEAYYRRKGPAPYQNPPWLGADQSYDWTDAAALTSQYVAERVLSLLDAAS